MNGEFAVCMNLVLKLSLKTLSRKCQEIHPDRPTRTIGRHGGGEETSRQQARAGMSRQSASCHRQADLPLSVSTLPRFLRGRERDGLVWRCVWLGQFVHGAQEGTREEGANQKKEKKKKRPRPVSIASPSFPVGGLFRVQGALPRPVGTWGSSPARSAREREEGNGTGAEDEGAKAFLVESWREGKRKGGMGHQAGDSIFRVYFLLLPFDLVLVARFGGAKVAVNVDVNLHAMMEDLAVCFCCCLF